MTSGTLGGLLTVIGIILFILGMLFLAFGSLDRDRTFVFALGMPTGGVMFMLGLGLLTAGDAR